MRYATASASGFAEADLNAALLEIGKAHVTRMATYLAGFGITSADDRLMFITDLSVQSAVLGLAALIPTGECAEATVKALAHCVAILCSGQEDPQAVFDEFVAAAKAQVSVVARDRTVGEA